MKVLIIGSGGREHAIADAFGRSSLCDKLYVSPGNAGIAKEYECLALDDDQKILAFCHNEGIDLVFIGPEQPIAEGLSDFLRHHNVKVFAPSQAAARLETSKAFAKDLMQRHHVPTARYQMIYDIAEAKAVLGEFSLPVVLKADGLAAGKGVEIAQSFEQAITICQGLLAQESGSTGVLVEEFLKGWEVSLFAITDGRDYQTTLFAQDHKQLYDNDLGPNTGGMGAYCPVVEAEPYRKTVEQDILEPVLAAMNDEGCPYTGVLYLGLMITNQGPKVIEFNCRFGDPETQALLPLLKTDFVEVCRAVTDCEVAKLKLEWEDAVCMAVVLAAQGYPGKYQRGIRIDQNDLESKAYYAGVASSDGCIVSSGGRVLSLVAKAVSIDEARRIVYRDVDLFSGKGLICRKDIGKRDNTLE
jgi:phosphoribosylamine---glycine ligase